MMPTLRLSEVYIGKFVLTHIGDKFFKTFARFYKKLTLYFDF